MKIEMMCAVSVADQAIAMAMEMSRLDYDGAADYAREKGCWVYGATCGDRDHLEDFIGGAVTGWACETVEDPEEPMITLKLEIGEEMKV